MEILSPVWPPAADGVAAKRRPTTVRGATVALLDDNLDPAFTKRLAALLSEGAGATVRHLVKPSGTAPAPTTLLDTAAGCDLAVVGIGL
jgi:hypothetical protein